MERKIAILVEALSGMVPQNLIRENGAEANAEPESYVRLSESEMLLLLTGIGLDTRKYTVSYLAEQLGIKLELSESNGEAAYLVESSSLSKTLSGIGKKAREGLSGLVDKGKGYLAMADVAVAPHLRKLIANKGLDANELARKASKLLHRHYYQGVATPDEERRMRADKAVDSIKRNELNKRSATSSDKNYFRPSRSSLVPGQEMDAIAARGSSNAHTIDEKGQKSAIEGEMLGFYSPKRHSVGFRNIDKPYSQPSAPGMKFNPQTGEAIYPEGYDSVGRIRRDIDKLKKTAAHEMTHLYDRVSKRKQFDMEDEASNKPGYSYADDPTEKRAREQEERLYRRIKPNIVGNIAKNTMRDLFRGGEKKAEANPRSEQKEQTGKIEPPAVKEPEKDGKVGFSVNYGGKTKE